MQTFAGLWRNSDVVKFTDNYRNLNFQDFQQMHESGTWTIQVLRTTKKNETEFQTSFWIDFPQQRIALKRSWKNTLHGMMDNNVKVTLSLTKIRNHQIPTPYKIKYLETTLPQALLFLNKHWWISTLNLIFTFCCHLILSQQNTHIWSKDWHFANNQQQLSVKNVGRVFATQKKLNIQQKKQDFKWRLFKIQK